MTYQVEYTQTALRQLRKMDKKITALIISYIEKRLVGCEDPRKYGKALQGKLQGKWRYRVGDYRILAKIEDAHVLIVVVEVGHRQNIYLP